jgi:hypothetical protein
MIASPGDVLTERNIAREVLHDWNAIHSLTTKTILAPVGWDSHTSPDLGGRPQKLINERVLKDCDLLVGIFWTRLGTPTGSSESGTVEEIKTHIAEGKPAMVYFSDAPVAPASLDSLQFEALRTFKVWCQQEGLISRYENLPDFQTKFARELQIQMNVHPFLKRLREGAEISGTIDYGRFFEPPPAELRLTDEARELLLEAALDPHGNILKLEYMSGSHVQANGKSFGEGSDRRAFARWEFAIEQLENEALIVAKGHKHQVFVVTAKGYEIADKLRRS